VDYLSGVYSFMVALISKDIKEQYAFFHSWSLLKRLSILHSFHSSLHCFNHPFTLSFSHSHIHTHTHTHTLSLIYILFSTLFVAFDLKLFFIYINAILYDTFETLGWSLLFDWCSASLSSWISTKKVLFNHISFVVFNNMNSNSIWEHSLPQSLTFSLSLSFCLCLSVNLYRV
jgi:hypothetical protein